MTQMLEDVDTGLSLYYVVTLDKQSMGAFSTCEGLGCEVVMETREEGGNNAFVHVSAVEKAGMNSLVQDQRISYSLQTDQRGKTSAVKIETL